MRARIGWDQAEWSVCGAAPILEEVLRFYLDLGVPICEVWGMSEGSAVSTCTPPDDIRIGSVGKALPGIEIRLLDDGEILVRGDTVMKGYRGILRRRPKRLTPTAGCTPATSPKSTTTDTCGSSTARRN